MMKMKAFAIVIVLFWTGFVSAQMQSADCLYTDSIDNFGWGWNPISETSCEPENPEATIALFVATYQAADSTATESEVIDRLRVDFCDYSDADAHSGYGWNNVLLESCAPLATDEVAGGGGSTMDVMGPPPAALPTVVSDITFSSEEYPLHLAVSSDGVLYTFQPATHNLVAMRLDGSELLWTQPDINALFITDILLTPDEDLLIVSSLGGQLAAFYLDGTMKWLVDIPGITGSAPIIDVGDTSIIAYFKTSSPSEPQLAPFIDSYDFEGSLQWRYESDLDIEGFTLGADGLVYVRLDVNDDVSSKRYVVLNQ